MRYLSGKSVTPPMNKSELRGVGQVFKFTVRQHFKSRATIVSLILFALVAAVSMPVLGILFSDSSAPSSPVKYVAIENSTPYPLTAEDIAAADARFAGIEEGELTSEGVQLEITEEEGSARIFLRTTPDTALSSDDLYAVGSAADSALRASVLCSLGAGGEELSFETGDYEDYANPKEATNTNFAASYGYSIVVMMLSLLSASYIIRSVVEEKSSKLVEFLTVSVRPMALMVGKVAAMAVVVFAFLFGTVIVGVLSYFVTSAFMDMSFIKAAIDAAGIGGAFGSMTALTVLAIVISFLLSYAFFATLGGLSGATCSTIEDSGSAIFLSMILTMTGYIFAIVCPAFENRAAILFGSLCPVLSCFLAPAAYLSGDISFGILALSWLIMAAAILVLVWFTARVYEALLMHRGKRVGLKQLFSLAKRGEAR